MREQRVDDSQATGTVAELHPEDVEEAATEGWRNHVPERVNDVRRNEARRWPWGPALCRAVVGNEDSGRTVDEKVPARSRATRVVTDESDPLRVAANGLAVQRAGRITSSGTGHAVRNTSVVVREDVVVIVQEEDEFGTTVTTVVGCAVEGALERCRIRGTTSTRAEERDYFLLFVPAPEPPRLRKVFSGGFVDFAELRLFLP